MSLNITGKNMDLTPAIKEYVAAKVEIFHSHVDSITQIDVEIDANTHHRNGEDVFHVRMNVQVPHELIHIEEEQGDVYAAIDACKDRVDRQLRQYKEKFTAKKQREWHERREMKTMAGGN